MIDDALWQQAASFAMTAHQGQWRRDGCTPYGAHPVRVALTLVLVFECSDPETIAAALLHDTIEDTTTDYDDLIDRFGRDVADDVASLSKDPRLVESDREPAYDRQLSSGSWRAKLIKLADVYDNLTDAEGAASIRVCCDRAERALTIAATEPRLESACMKVRTLVARRRGEAGP